MWTTYYTLNDLQACEPTELLVDPHVSVVLETEHDDTSAGCARVTLVADSKERLGEYLLDQWGDAGDWTAEQLERVEEHANVGSWAEMFAVVDAYSGVELGRFNVHSPLAALDAFAEEEGVATYSSCIEDAPMMGDEIVHALVDGDLVVRAVFSNTEVEARRVES